MSTSIVVLLADKLTVATAERTHAQLREAFADAREIVLDASRAQDVDVAFLQLLASAQRAAARAGKTVRLAAPPGGALAEAMRRCGLASTGSAALAELFPT